MGSRDRPILVPRRCRRLVRVAMDEGSAVHCPAIEYATTVDGLSIAYQCFGTGELEVVYLPGTVSHLGLAWENDGQRSWTERFAARRRRGFGEPVGALPVTDRTAIHRQIVASATISVGSRHPSDRQPGRAHRLASPCWHSRGAVAAERTSTSSPSAVRTSRRCEPRVPPAPSRRSAQLCGASTARKSACGATQRPLSGM